MLVAGNSLHHPLQSIENGFRQFLACNQLFSLQYIRRELMGSLNRNPSVPSQRAMSTIQLYRDWAKPAVTHLGLHEHRNCRLCALSFYHSYLYQLPWLHACPLHPHERLLEQCPECRRPWFTPNAECNCCGTSVNFLTIIQQRRLLEVDWACLNVLESIINRFSQCRRLTHLTPKGVTPSADENDSLFPSIMAHLFPETRALFQRLEVDIYLCDQYTFNIQYKPHRDTISKTLYRTKDSSFTQQCIDQVAATIQFFMAQADSTPSPSAATQIQPDDNFFNVERDAFFLWKHLVTSKSSWSPYSNDCTQCYQIAFGISGPARPELTSFLAFSDYPEGGFPYIEIPQDAQKILYEFELWLKYLSIAEALQYFNAELTKPFDSRAPISALAYPDVSIVNIIGIIEQDGQILFVFPQWLGNRNPKQLIDFFRKIR